MKAYRNYLIILVLLLAVAGYFLLTNKNTTLKIESTQFALKDTGNISLITIISGADTLVLEKAGDNWLVNRKYNARLKLINAILGVMQTVTINSPVPKDLQDQLLAQFDKQKTYVCFESHLQPKLEFELAEIQSLNSGTVIRQPGNSDMYIAEIPGYSVKLNFLLSPKPAIWTDFVLLRFKPWEILNIKLDYPKQAAQSFELDLTHPDEIILSNGNHSEKKKIQKEHIVRYLYSFNNVPYTPLNKNTGKIKKGEYLCKLTVTNSLNQNHVIQFYERYLPEKPMEKDLFSLFAFIGNDTLPVIVKYTDFDPIAKTFSSVTEL